MSHTNRPGALDRAFDALGHPSRRQILSHVGRNDAPLRVTDLVDVFPGGDPDGFATGVHHVHLPKLAAAGYAEWDVTRGLVRRGPNFDEVGPLLDALDEVRDVIEG